MSTDRWRAARRERGGGQPSPGIERPNPFALSKACELDRADTDWSPQGEGDRAQRGGGVPVLQPATDRGPVWRSPKHREVPRPDWRPQGRRDPLQPQSPGSGGWDARADAAAGDPRPKRGWAAYQDVPDSAQCKPAQTQAMDRPRVLAAKADGHKHHQNAQLTERPRCPVSRTPDRPNAPGPARSGEALALALAHKVGSRRLVAATCAGAQVAGVQPALTVAQALLLVPDLHVAEAEPEQDAAELARLARWAARHVSPLVGLNPPDGLFIDATGLAHLWGGEAALIDRLVQAMAERGYAARAAIADTPGAAWGWARFGPGGVLPPGAQARALDRLALDALRLEPQTADALAAVGIVSVGELAALPRAPAVKRFGPQPFARLDDALGRRQEPIQPIRPPRVLEAALACPEPLMTAEPLAEAVRRLLTDLTVRLAAGGLGARRLRLAFMRVDGAVQAIALGTARPTRDAAHLARLLLPRLETVDPGFGIEAARLTALRVEPLAPQQLGGDAAAEEGLAELVDRLTNNAEAARVATPAPRESDMPERSVRWSAPLPGRWRGLAARQRRRERGVHIPPTTWPASLPRPPRLIHPPEAVDAIAMLPDHPPVRFTWRGRSHRVVRADGPERLHGEWWRVPAETGAVRDYFQVETQEGRRFWLFRSGDGEDPATGAMDWWCHGVFG